MTASQGLDLQVLNQSMTERSKRNYEHRYFESTKETLVGLYSQRVNGEPTETVSEIVSRVADAIAIAELRYILSEQEIIDLTLEQALNHQAVIYWSNVFADCIGNQVFWVNTPGNINADPKLSLKVLQYEAHGKLAGFYIDQIWTHTEQYMGFYRSNPDTSALDSIDWHKAFMGKLACELKGKGMLAACGVTFIEDTLDSIQDTARIMTIAAKNSMGMGINSSNLRPWSSQVGNGAAASGPDRFYAKTIASSVQAVAQGGRRGGALIEWRNSDHPDILFFIHKKRLPPAPNFEAILEQQLKSTKGHQVALNKAAQEYARLNHEYLEKQNYLLNTNVSVLAMPGFIEAAKQGLWYRATFQGKPWTGKLYDCRRPKIDPKTGEQVVNRLTKELEFEEYSVNLEQYPDAKQTAIECAHNNPIGGHIEYTDTWVRVPGYFYGPDIFDCICEGMRNGGEPGIGFYDLMNESNANDHQYDLFVSNPCSEQVLPSGPSKDGKRHFMGICNLSSLHAAHEYFWNRDGSYNFQKMREYTKIQQRAMENVVDVTWFPIPAQNLTARLERRTGGGFAGVAEYLSRLGFRFGTRDALQVTETLFQQYSEASLEASIEFAQERGVYPLWEGSQFERMGLRVRNACIVNNAPTGTLAQAMQTTWGVDPHNGIVFSRKVRSKIVDFVAPGFKDMMSRYGVWPETEPEQEDLMKRIRDNGKTVRGLKEIPQVIQDAFPLRIEITPNEYIEHLAACYRGIPEYQGQPVPYVFNAISNTCSIESGLPLKTIQDMVFLAYQLGVKAFTCYPDGSRLSQPTEQIAKGPQKEQRDILKLLGVKETRRVQTDLTEGATLKIKIGDGNGGQTLHISLNHEVDRPGELIEIYARLGKAGAVEAGLLEAVGRLSSAFLQYSAQFGEGERKAAQNLIVKQLSGIESCFTSWVKMPDKEKPLTIRSACDGVARAIEYYDRSHSVVAKVEKAIEKQNEQFLQSNPSLKDIVNKQKTGPSCSKCGSGSLVKIDGCTNCEDCGYSMCG